MFVFFGQRRQSGRGVLHCLELLDVAVGQSGEGAVTVIQPGRDEGMDEGLCRRLGQVFANAGHTAQLKICRFTDGSDVRTKGECVIKDDAQISGRRDRFNGI